MEEESRNKAMEAQLQSIPYDLVVDILTQLPVKSLLRFRCVCKLWCSLTSDPQFIKSLATENNNLKFLIIKSNSDIGFESLYTIDYKTSICKFEFRDICFNIKDFDQILGSCNGLLVIADFYKTKAVLWNPLTREYRRVLDYPDKISYYHSLSGLGFDSSSDGYKLIIANTDYFQTYSVGTESWTTVQKFPYSLLNYHLATLVNGTPHWIVNNRANNRIHGFRKISLIIYFDFKEEKFQEVDLPQSSKYFDLVLGVVGGCLCVARNDLKSHVEIWLMKDYGVKESWTKLFVIHQFFDYLKPLCFVEHGKVLLEILQKWKVRRVVIYDPNKSVFEDIQSEILMGDFKTAAYTESLISPNTLVHQNKQICR